MSAGAQHVPAFLIGQNAAHGQSPGNALGEGRHVRQNAVLLEGEEAARPPYAGLVVQETLTDAFLEDVRAKGTYLRNQIEALDLPCFGATRGMGLMIGIQVKDGWTNKEIASKLIENGLLVLTAGPSMRLLPPLVISQEEMDQGLEILKKTLS